MLVGSLVILSRLTTRLQFGWWFFEADIAKAQKCWAGHQNCLLMREQPRYLSGSDKFDG
jgi:hypothetical protein